MNPNVYKSLDELLTYAPESAVDPVWSAQFAAHVEHLQDTLSALGEERDNALTVASDARASLSLYLDLHDSEETPFCAHSDELRALEKSLEIDERGLTEYETP